MIPDLQPPCKVLQRASSVPTRVPEVPSLKSLEITQSQQEPDNVPSSAPPALTPSTTEESVAAVSIEGIKICLKHLKPPLVFKINKWISAHQKII